MITVFTVNQAKMTQVSSLQFGVKVVSHTYSEAKNQETPSAVHITRMLMPDVLSTIWQKVSIALIHRS